MQIESVRDNAERYYGKWSRYHCLIEVRIV